MKKLLSILAIALTTLTAMAQTEAPAFPGAEGHGRYVTGGRGGVVRHVTTLADSGTGSLRAAVNGAAKKIVVFDVGGVIELKSDLTIGANTTILGQTAPNPGITLRYRTIRPSSNNIIRFVRFRRGEEQDVNDGADATWQRGATGIIFDHCSFSWSIDEIASFYDNRDFTMQWCTLGEALANAGHTKEEHSYGGIWGGKGASFHHNFLCHMQNRVPRFCGARYGDSYATYDKTKYANAIQAEMVDFRNCVMYNWGNGNGCYGGTGGGYINIVNNYYKAGPATANKTRVTQVSVATSSNAKDSPFMGYASRYYINGNYVTAASTPANYDWSGVIYDSGLTTINGERYIPDADHKYGNDVTYVTQNGKDYVRLKLDSPVDKGEVTTHSAEKAYEKVLAYVGASMYRDGVDARYMDEAKNGTTTYIGSAEKQGNGDPVTHRPGIIDKVADQGVYKLESTKHPDGFDTDGDGIPDAWETANGLNPNDASDATTYTLDPKGYYTNLEVYANALVEDIMKQENADAIDAVSEYYPEVKKAEGIAYYDGTAAKGTFGKDNDDNPGTDPGTDPTPGNGEEFTVSFNGADSQTTANYFTFEGNHNFNSKFAGTYDGTDYTSGLKLENGTIIKFTTTATSTVTIVQSDWESKEVAHGTPKTISFDNTELSVSSATKPEGSSNVLVYTIENVAPGEHTIKRTKSESGVLYVSVKYSSASAISTVAISGNADGAVYNLAGQRVADGYKGIVVKNGRKMIVK